MKESGIFDITGKLPLLKNITLKKSEPRKTAFDDVQEFQVEYLDSITGEAPAELPTENPVAMETAVMQKPEVVVMPQTAQPAMETSSVTAAEEPEVPDEIQEEQIPVIRRIWDVIRILAMAAYRLRAVFLAIPVIFLALRLAAYNSEHLPLLVGLDLQSNGEFAKTISRQTAVTMPLLLTGGCLALMCFSRKTLYPWLISLFSLAIPVLLLLTNMYPA
jgi:hypothetical protein